MRAGCSLKERETGPKSDPCGGSAITNKAESHRVLTWLTELGAGNRVHWQSQTWRMMNQSQGPCKGFSHEQNVVEQGTGLETGIQQDWAPESFQ